MISLQLLNVQTWWLCGFKLECFVNHKNFDLGKAVVYVA